MGSILHVPLFVDNALDAAAIQALSGHLAVAAPEGGGAGRLDSEGNNGIDRYARAQLEQVQARYDSWVAQPANKVRADAFGGQAWHQPRDLEHIYQQILEEERPSLDATTLFPVDTSVPLGATEHTVSRVFMQGEAKWIRGGEDTPLAQVSKVQEKFPVKYMASGWETNIFDGFSNAYSGTQPEVFKQRAAIRAIDEKIDETAWYGDKSADFYGILDYPFLAKSVSTINYASGTPDDILADALAGRNWPSENSLQVFSPNALCTTERVRNLLMQTPRTTVSDRTIGEQFLMTNGSISSFSTSYRLQGRGPSGEDGMFYYGNDANSVSISIVQGPTMLPTQRDGYMDRTYVFAAFGGTIMRNSGNNHLRWVPVN